MKFLHVLNALMVQSSQIFLNDIKLMNDYINIKNILINYYLDHKITKFKISMLQNAYKNAE